MLKASQIDFSYGSKQLFNQFSLSLQENQITTLIGPNGSGKSTLFRLLTRAIRPSAGTITLDGQDIWQLAAKDFAKKVAIVHQQNQLYDQITVKELVKMGRLPYHSLMGDEENGSARLQQIMQELEIADLADKFIAQLSGGQQQRVAIARSLVNQPRVLLLDEPLGALDLKLRKEMQLELKRLQREMNITFVYVTHDQEEALTMSDTVVVMSGGNIQQIGSPQDIYNEPRNAFVARFIGDSNIVDGFMIKDFLVNFGGHDFTCVDRGFKPNEPVQVVIRPEDVQIVPPSVGMLTGLVREVIFKGVHFEMHVDVEGYEWLIHSTQASQPGELIGMNIGPDEIHIMARTEV